MSSSTSNKCVSHARFAEESKPDVKLTLFPNPTAGMVSIISNVALSDVKQLIVYDLVGKQHTVPYHVGDQNIGIDVDLSGVTEGMDLIKVTTIDSEYVLRVVKH